MKSKIGYLDWKKNEINSKMAIFFSVLAIPKNLLRTLGLFCDRTLLCGPGWPRTPSTPLCSAFLAGITGMFHHTFLILYFLIWIFIVEQIRHHLGTNSEEQETYTVLLSDNAGTIHMEFVFLNAAFKSIAQSSSWSCWAMTSACFVLMCLRDWWCISKKSVKLKCPVREKVTPLCFFWPYPLCVYVCSWPPVCSEHRSIQMEPIQASDALGSLCSMGYELWHNNDKLKS